MPLQIDDESDRAKKEISAFGGREFKLLDDSKPGSFEGYGAVFGNVDAYGDVIVKGAFRETLKRWQKVKRWAPMLLNHGGYGAADDVPIGVFDEMGEDDTGLRVKGRLIALEADLPRRVYSAMKEGALDGMSIGYRAKEFSYGTSPGEPRRTLKSVDLVEVSIVTFPANPSARVDGGVKSTLTIRDAEKALRDVGFRHEDAKAILASGYKTLRGRDGQSDVGVESALQGLLAKIRK
jgi:uncharacterized protein